MQSRTQQSRSLDAMNLTWVVDSGCTRCALPKQFFKNAKSSRTTVLTSSNGASNAPIYRCERMPRLKEGGAAPETREIIGIDGPPCLSMGMQVETNPSPAGFWYGKKFQGYIWGDHAEKIDKIVAEAHAAEHVTPIPAYNYEPCYNPKRDVEETAKMNLAVAMLDHDFRADVEKLEAVCNDPNQCAALQTILEATLVVDTLEDVIEQAQLIMEKAAAGEDMHTLIREGDCLLAAGEKRAKAASSATKKSKNDNAEMI